MNVFRRIQFLIMIVLLMVSCKKTDPQATAIAHLGTQIHVERFDKAFANTRSLEDFAKLKLRYPFMFDQKHADAFWLDQAQDTLLQELHQAISTVIPDMTTITTQIESCFNHIRYYFPKFRVPRVITAISMVDYRHQVIVTDSLVLISLDTYLGAQHEFYRGIPKYIAANLKPSQIVVDMAASYAQHYIGSVSRKTLLDEMIYFGKVLYFKDRVIPFKSEAERISYSDTQLAWAQKNESEIWRYFVDRELLFSTDASLPSRFINPAPFSKFYLEHIDNDSPGRLGQYIGWQIVRAYMTHHKNTSLKALLKTPSETIFNTSKFKPRK